MSGEDLGAARELGERTLSAVCDLISAHYSEGDTEILELLGHYIAEVCEEIDRYGALSELRRQPFGKRSTPMQTLMMWRGMTCPEVEPFRRAALRLGAEDKRMGRSQFSIRRVAAKAGYEKEGRTSLANIEKRYGFKLRGYLKACYESERNPSKIDMEALRAAPVGQRYRLLHEQTDNNPDNNARKNLQESN